MTLTILERAALLLAKAWIYAVVAVMICGFIGAVIDAANGVPAPMDHGAEQVAAIYWGR